ncbi:glycosyltransferase [Dehalococcoides mccartyi]|nr:glycosyltransferase [Dehalococcoides mccartyi]
MFTNIPTPYRVPLFEKWASQSGVELEIVFLAETEATRSWRGLLDDVKFEFKVLGSPWYWRRFGRKSLKLNSGVWSAIRRFQPDVIITAGYDEIAYWKIALYCKLTGTARVNWSGTTLHTGRGRRFIGRKLKTIFARSADASVTYGSLAARYLESLGAEPDSIVTGVNTTDVTKLAEDVETTRANSSFGIERDKYPLFLISVVGRLLRFKGVDDILMALAEIDSPDIGMLVVGDGPDQSRLEELVENNSIRNVFFVGFAEGEKLVEQYALTDLAVFASHSDVWGMVVNESLAAGIYTLCSTGAGAHADLIVPGIDGDLFEPGDINEIKHLIESAFSRAEWLRESRTKISEDAVELTDPRRHIQALMRSTEIAIEKSKQ